MAEAKTFDKGDLVVVANASLDSVPAKVIYKLGDDYVCRLTAVHEGFLVLATADQLTATK